MRKTNSGIALGAMGAVVYFTALLGGYIPLFLLGGFIFLKEDSDWLKRAVYKAAALMLVFSALIAVVDMLNELLGIFNCLLEWELEVPFDLDHAVKNVVSIVKTIMFSVLGFKAMRQKDVSIPTIDSTFLRKAENAVNNEKE